jgi:glucosyl-3-phosphoglycerate synthase
MNRAPLSRDDIARWIQRRTFFRSDTDVTELRDRKHALNLAVSVVVPVLSRTDVRSTCTEIMSVLGAHGVVDEMVVIDATPEHVSSSQVEATGARSYHVDEVLPEITSSRGWGDAIWRSQYVTFGDVVVWLRAEDATPDSVIRLVEPLVANPDIGFVRGFRTFEWTGDTLDVFALPALVELFPELSGFYQPFRGSSAGNAGILSQLPITDGPSADIAMLVDLLDLLGLDRMGQVDLGPAMEEDGPAVPTSPVARLLLRRAGDRGRIPATPGEAVRSLQTLADADTNARLDRENLPMHYVPAYLDALRRHAAAPRRRPITAALRHW